MEEKTDKCAANKKRGLTRSGLPLWDGTTGKHFEGEYARKCAIKSGQVRRERAKLRGLLLGAVREKLTADDCKKIKQLVSNTIDRAAEEGDAAALERITKTFGLHFDDSEEAAGSKSNPICTNSSAPVIKFSTEDGNGTEPTQVDLNKVLEGTN